MVVYPAYPEYGKDWPTTRGEGEGGGPGIFTAMALAKEIEELLNVPYTPEVVLEWKKREKQNALESHK